MEKRLVIFLVLSVLIIFSYPYIIERFYGQTRKETVEGEIKKEKIEKKDEGPLPSMRIGGERSAPPLVAEREKVIETDLYRAVLSNVGGTIKKWELKRFTKKGEGGREVPVELVPEKARTFPLAVVGPDATSTHEALYELEDTPLRLSKERPEAAVEMVMTSPEGERITKKLKFYNDQYWVDIDLTIGDAPKRRSLSLGTNFGIEDWGQQFSGGVGAIDLIDQQLVKDNPAKFNGEVIHEGKAAWVALHDKYFISALIPREPNQVGPTLTRKEGEKEVVTEVRLLPDGGGKLATRFSLYAGPKEYDRLAGLHIQLEEAIDFGWFILGSWAPVRIVAKPLFYILRFFYRFTHNYGVAIILVTVLVKALFFPITRKSLNSMKAMAEIQPEIVALRKKWANDKERLNRELMNLYKERKINPLSGCLPMLVQIPVFIALFNILYNTIELRQAPFIFWIRDLSDKDPYYILPIIMGVTMFFQQLTQPTTMDPTQAKVMLFLPIVYTFFFLNFPSGLVLYWLVNNLLSIGQQYLMKREGFAIPKTRTA